MLNNTVRNPEDSATPPRPHGRGAGEAAASARYSGARSLNTAPVNAGRIAKIGTPDSGRRTVTPEKILQSFNTWAFKREQPAEPQLMLQFIGEAASCGAPIPFVLYWGKGPRCTLDEPEIQCLNYLASLAARVREAYAPGAAVKLIFTDTHATLNGHSPENMRAYFEAVAIGARLHGFESCRLGELIRGVEAEPQDQTMPQEMLQSLSDCAKKWYRGEGTAEQGALQYYQMNMVEKRAVELAFPRAIFITFNGSEFRSLFPKQLPIFYMYSLRRGFGVKPWFLPASAGEAPVTAPAAAAPAV